MKKMLLRAIALGAVMLCLSGCYIRREKYAQEDADRIAAAGTEKMQSWLAENMPEATLEECAPFIAWSSYNRDEYLTDYATGRISREGKQTSFAIHTLTGAVYFEMDADTRQKLTEITETYCYEALETLGILPESTAEGYAFQCHVMAPVLDGDSAADIPGVISLDFGLPYGVEDLETFVRNPDSRLSIYVDPPEITVSDSVDLSQLDLASIEALEAEYGLHISLSLRNANQIFSKTHREDRIQTHLLEYGTLYETDGITLYGLVRERKEVKNRETGEQTVTDMQLHPETDLIFEKTDSGYQWSVLKEDWPSGFTLSAREGAEILNYDYYYLDAEEEPSEDSRKTLWLERDDCYVLASGSNQSALNLCDGDKLVRIEN